MQSIPKKYRSSKYSRSRPIRAGGQQALRRRAQGAITAIRAQNIRFGPRRNISTLGSALGIEKKFYDTALAAGAIGAATDATGGELDPSATSMISTPAQGDTEQTCDGKRIIIKSVQLKGTLNNPAAAAAASPELAAKVFVAIVLDTQSNAAQMNSEDCFKNLAGTALGAPHPLRNLLFSNRFRVLKYDVFDVSHETLAGVSASLNSNSTERNFDWFLPLDLPVNFNAGTTASIVNVIDNSLHVIAFGSQASITITYNARIRFVG